MKRRGGKGAPSADLLVCFPARAHLTLMPKPVSSPARPKDPNKQPPNHRRHQHQQQRLLFTKSISRSGRGGDHSSPLSWSRTKQMGSELASEPTSPKVTCAGQIKVRPNPGPCKNWQSVMEEIERLHNNQRQKKRAPWVEALGFKKEIMQFLACLRSVRFDFRCFGSLPHVDITSDDEDEEEEEDEFGEEVPESKTTAGENEDKERPSGALFSKWFMVLQESPNRVVKSEQGSKSKESENSIKNQDEETCTPPPNALLLMRCLSAPAKSWQEEELEERKREREEEKEEGSENYEATAGDEEEKEDEQNERKEEFIMGQGGKRKKSLEELMRNEGSEFYKLSCDIARETWIVGGIRDALSRSRSWKI